MKPDKVQINRAMPVPTSPVAGSGGIVDATRFGQRVNPNIAFGGIVQNIPRKNGNIRPAPNSNTVTAAIFPYAGINTTFFVQPGTAQDQRDNRFFGRMGPNPAGAMRNTATLQIQASLGTYGQGVVVTNAVLPEVQPHEKGNVWRIPNPDINKKTAIVRAQGGINPNANTARNPKPVLSMRQQRRPSHDGKSIISANAPSYPSFHTLRGGTGAMDHVPRWSTVKFGAVHRWNQPTSTMTGQ